MMEVPKEKKGFLQFIIWAITGAGVYYIGDSVLSGEVLNMINILIAGGSITIAQAINVGLMVFTRVVPVKTANNINESLKPFLNGLNELSERLDRIEQGQVYGNNILEENKRKQEELLG